MIAGATAACVVIQSPEFQAALAGEKLRERCDSQRRISGSEIVALLRGGLPDYWVELRISIGRTRAVTNLALRRMRIQRRRIRDWADGGEQASLFIGTLVHEMTHLVPAADGVAQRFQDEGYGSKCPASDLVSYRTGELASLVWKQMNGIGARQGRAD
jgi:hypothetical protein